MPDIIIEGLANHHVLLVMPHPDADLDLPGHHCYLQRICHLRALGEEYQPRHLLSPESEGDVLDLDCSLELGNIPQLHQAIPSLVHQGIQAISPF